MSDAKTTNQTRSDDAPPRVGKLWVLAAFFAVVVVILGGDLWLKSWSFKHYAVHPLQVVGVEGGPDIYRPGEEGEPDRVLLERGPGGHPASAIPNRKEPVVVVPGLLNMRLTLNTGAVFGIGEGQRWLFIVVSIFATGVILVLVWRSPPGRWVYPIALGMILAGALGNLYDRVRFSAVRDMLHMLPQTELWPWIFNLADVALVVGVCVLLLMSFIEARAEKKLARTASTPSTPSA